MKFSLVTMATLTAASAKDLSIGMFNDDWEIEKKCSTELDTIHQALLAHVAEIMPESFDDNNLKIPYECPIYCADLPDWLCSRITRGYCSGSSTIISIDPIEDVAASEGWGNNWNRGLAAIGADEASAELNADIDDREAGEVAIEPTEDIEDNRPDIANRELYWHCPTYCKIFASPWWCEEMTHGYCWAAGARNWNRDLAALDTDKPVEIKLEGIEHPLPYDCPTYCRRVPSWLCARITNGSCPGSAENEIGEEKALSLRGASSEPADDDCDQAIAAMEAKFGEMLGNLEDESCAIAIMKANVVFKCSRNEQATA